ncbi:MAG: ATP-binding cassette domain-containing protein, partial [Gemmataceae bacterium]|nr:ATP-binding cassette domain-containing protein [Gemmataceae bacterium]
LVGSAGPARLIVVVAILAAMLRPLNGMFEQRRTLKKAQAAAVPIFEFLDRPAEVGQVVGAEFLAGIERGIEMRGVSLREPGSGRLLLNDVNLKIKPGQRIAIVGPDEAEKRAIVYLLQRFLDATTGEVRIDDKGVKWLTLESLRSQIGGVMTDSLVFNDTVANNIGCGDPSVTMPQIIECAKLAHVHQFVQKLPHGYETAIGSFGLPLKRNEKFRIALARAILKDPSVFVIEEPAEPFDDAAKALIDDTLSRVLQGKTVIFLAHRISTIRSCDLVYLIHRGQVEASGEHRELIAKSDLYKHLHYMEFNEFAQA